MRRATWGIVAAIGAMVMSGAASAGDLAKAWMGEITVEKVNIRAGIGKNYEIVANAKKGDHVIVVEEKLDWCRIVAPSGVKCWVHKKFVAREGKTGTVNADRVNIRSHENTSNTSYVLGQLPKGASLTILEEKGDFFRVTPPEGTAYAWVAKEFLKNLGSYEAAKAQVEAETAAKKAAAANATATVKRFEDAQSQERMIDAQPLDMQDFSGVIASYRAVAAEKAAGDLCAKAEARLKDLVPRQQALDEYHHTLVAMRKAEAQHAQQVAELTAPPETKYLAIGTVDSFGKLINSPGASHKLIKGGNVLFFLKSDQFDLNKYLNRLVGIQGVISDAPAGYEGNRIVTVTSIEVLGTPAPEPAMEEGK